MILILNIFFPGWGTMVSACLGSECRTATVLLGLLQLILAPLIIGWVWSIIWGLGLRKKAIKEEQSGGAMNRDAANVEAPPPVA